MRPDAAALAGANPQEKGGKHDWMALLLLVPAPTLGTAASLLIWPEGVWGKGLFLAAKLWIVLLPLVWVLLVDRKPISWSPPRQGGFGMATLLGLTIAAVILCTYAVGLKIGLVTPEIISARAAQTGLNRLAFFLGGALYWVTLNSLMEELSLIHI